MIPKDFYNNCNSDPELRGLNNLEACYEDNVEGADVVVPLYSTIGRGPRGLGVTPRVVQSTENSFIFELVDDNNNVVMTSDNIHAGHVSFTNDKYDSRKMIVTVDREGDLQQYTITLPQSISTRIYSVTNEFVPREINDTGIYLEIPKSQIIVPEKDKEIVPEDVLIFPCIKKIEASGTTYSTSYLAFARITSVLQSTVNTYAIEYIPAYDIKAFWDLLIDYCNTIVGKFDDKGELLEEGYESKARIKADNALSERITKIEHRTDVVDVVASYAELIAYAPSELENGNIIKVLKDETHDNQISYYRLTDKTKKPEERWLFIGSTGPYVFQQVNKPKTIYGKDGSDKETNIAYGLGTDANVIVQRDSDGHIIIKDGEQPFHPATIQQLNDKAGKAHKHDITDINQIDVNINEVNSLKGITSNIQQQLEGTVKKAGSNTIEGNNTFIKNPTDRTGMYKYLHSNNIIAGEGILITKQEDGSIKIDNTMLEFISADKGDIIFTTELKTEAEVIDKKGGQSWELLSSESGVYEWHCLVGGREKVEITISPDKPVILWDSDKQDIEITIETSDPTSNVSTDILSGDNITIS